MTGIPAIYKDGAFYPLQPVELPEQTNVVVMLQQPTESREVQAILNTAGVWANVPGIDDILQEMEDMRRSAVGA
jgi:predicted DNA-binding antitoxin AbrB/MazE fold protein